VGSVAAVTALLETRALSKRFGGVEAVGSVDLRIERGEIRALIGPNGAGKTTLVSMICGRIAPTSGRILFKNREITKTKVYHRVAFGIVYTFQISSIFKHLTAFENVALAVQRRVGGLDRDVLAREVADALAHTGLAGVRDRLAGSLPHGHQKLLELSMALALHPQLLVLDEPTQGLAREEIGAVSRLIQSVAGAATILLIEHNMQVVLDLSRRISVMDRGRIIAEGTPAEIEANREVQRVYLGP
jgi:branched-chain amino acid transport system ATP-binding protein